MWPAARVLLRKVKCSSFEYAPLMGVCSVLKEEVADVDRDAQALSRIERPNVAIDGELHSAFDGKALVDAQRGWTDKDLVGFRAENRRSALEHTAVFLADEFSE